MEQVAESHVAEFAFQPLTPASVLHRAASAFAQRLAIVDGDLTFTYGEFAARCARLRLALTGLGLSRGDRVAALCANSHVMLELHHSLPGASLVLVPINTRLSPDEMRYIVDHSGASHLVATTEHEELACQLAAVTGVSLTLAGPRGALADDYEQLLASSPSSVSTRSPFDRAIPDRPDLPGEHDGPGERDLLAINYTSGTTGRPKGVMYHHRGAFLQAVAMAHHLQLGPATRYLWTLPMFHCNGWCLTWAVTAAGGTHVCLRSVDTAAIWKHLLMDGITHLSAAPTVLTMIGSASEARNLHDRVHVDTGGSPPSPTLLARMDSLGFDVTHLYGLTETFGPIAINEWQPEWSLLDPGEQALLKARQGIGNIIAAPLRVLAEGGDPVPADGQTVGEIAVRGNDLMLGYYRDPEATIACTRNGHFLTGDLGVMHPDGYVEIRDRGKDIIISGGENIASIEIERAIDTHPAVAECAVVAAADEKWGEVPIAFVATVPGVVVTVEELTAHARTSLARFKVPRLVVFSSLPKTSTGKIQKNLLRESATHHWQAAGEPATTGPHSGGTLYRPVDEI